MPSFFRLFNNGEIYKYGTAQDYNTGFSGAVEKRYKYQKAQYGIIGFNFLHSPNPSANVTAVNMTPYGAIPRTQALLLEKILIFNHALFKIQAEQLNARGIKTNHNLPPGNKQFN